MFGYIKPVPAELKVKEYELYKSVYCGLCAALGRNSTCVSRLTLSYDFVFLALFRMTLSGECGEIKRRRCIAHPAKKRAVLHGAAGLDYSAAVSTLLTYGKLFDDINDERGSKRLAAKALLPAAKSMRKKAMSRLELSELDGAITKRLSELSELERARVYSPDAAAEPFGALMADVFSYGYTGAEQKIASEVGRHIGRFIYIVDAADDLRDDLEKGRYNPFRVEGKTDDEILSEFEARKGALEGSLTMELVGIERALALVLHEKTPEFFAIIENIIYLGLPELIKKTVGTDLNAMEKKI